MSAESETTPAIVDSRTTEQNVNPESKPADLDKSTPYGQLAVKLEEILIKTGHNEMYGVTLESWKEGSTIPIATQIILQKFLRANANDVSKAAEQLSTALAWRKSFGALATKTEVFSPTRFTGLGYVLPLTNVPESPNAHDVAVFNIYGAVKDNKATFGDLDGFIRWRVALMELTLEKLDIANATEPLPDYGTGVDKYQALQVHDYLSVSFLRQASEVKAASSKTIQLFQQMYPETMRKKYFVNVPLVMQWMFGAMKMVMAKETVAKMQWTSYGEQLCQDLGNGVPKVYGGNGPELEGHAHTPRYESITDAPDAPAPSKTESTAATAGSGA